MIIIFLGGLLLYAACHRAGIIGSEKDKGSVTENFPPEGYLPVSVHFDQWIFSAHPDNGLTVSTGTGEVIHHIPDFRARHIEIISEPDTTGKSLGWLFVNGDPGIERPCFRMMKDGLLEKLSS